MPVLSVLWNLWRGKFIDPFSGGSLSIWAPIMYHQIYSSLMINRNFYTNKRGDFHTLVSRLIQLVLYNFNISIVQ